ncbi:polysaccharide biosynthesis/export family protein [Pelobacter propionicus]|uniref:Polysaccharide export protein n=1 Tax=Pelobacter propionicus (strain DSM 2379 / NBRC 103807 / OttBd1) TaxID=338966 RepID=A1AUH5_PELPD|nr:SLBB domain-containing protein [Pelobacter propionicus]ABL00996.1 polysaccharide export protein [Pelobacter propionicus DSM 2379]
MNRYLIVLLLLLSGSLPVLAAGIQSTTQYPAQYSAGYSTKTSTQTSSQYFGQSSGQSAAQSPSPLGSASSTPTFPQQVPGVLTPPSTPQPAGSGAPQNGTAVPGGEQNGRAMLNGAPSRPEDLLSDADRARLLEYRQMTEDERGKVSKFCMMTDFERMVMEKYCRMTENEKADDPDFARLSDAERARVMEYSRITEIEKSRYDRYCSIVDLETVSSNEREDVSEIERAISDPRSDDELFRPQPLKMKRLEQFGYNFFRPDASAFSSLTDVPVGDDYLVGPGDRIILQLWGSIDGVHELEVNRSGEVLLPRVGAVKVWGVPFGGLHELFRRSLATIFKDFQLNVNMGKLRMMKVYIVGEVRSPGDYNLSSLSTVISALTAAGGPTKNGSLRNIQIRRVGKLPQSVDLYDFFLRGDRNCDVRLQPGDTIYVPVLRKVAAIGGNVRRPAIFELKDEKRLTDLLRLAAGISVTGSLQRIQIAGINAHDNRQVRDFNIDPRKGDKQFTEITDSIGIRHMDSVRIFSINSVLRGQVRVEGYALHPGDYALAKGMRVKDLFGPEDVLPETYRDVAVITRMLPPDYLQEKISINLGQALAGEPDHNLELKEFDRITLFSRWDMEEMPMARISGEVQKPGSYRVYERMSLRDLIFNAGNIKKSAYLKSAEISRSIVDKEGVRAQIIDVDLEEALKGNPAHNVLIEKMDEVIIRRIPNWVDETGRYVTLRGEVMFPGVYPVLKGETLSSVIRRAGGYTDRAYLKGAKFTRKSVAEIQQKKMDEILAKTEDSVAKKQAELASTASSKEELAATQAALDGLQKNIQRLKKEKAEGRVSIALAPLDKLQKSGYDLELLGGDNLEIPQSTGTVMVYGEVFSPTNLVQRPGKDVAYYLRKAGGPTSNANEDEIYVIKVDGTVVSRAQSGSGISWDEDARSWSFGGFKSTPLDAGDTIVVPQEMDRIAWTREIKDIATILGQVALMVGVVAGM